MTLTHILKRFNNEVQTSEMFNTAGRSMKSGLVAAAVVSSWTWAATLLQSSAVCYRYGISGPLWYASGACCQVVLFATLAVQLKKRAPNAHTFLEVIRARYGAPAHFTFMVFALVTNVLVSLMLIAGGAATINALTGMHGVAAIFLMPVPVVAYTFFGGLKATFITDYIHGAAVLIIVITFALTAYSTSDKLGSPGAVYDLLVEAATVHPVAGNHEGSYLTMNSSGGATFFVINIVGNFGTVFLGTCFNMCNSFPNVDIGCIERCMSHCVDLVCRQRILEQSYCGFSCTRTSGLYNWWHLVVRDSVAYCDHSRVVCACIGVGPQFPHVPGAHERG